VPGVKRTHLNALLGASFFTIGLMTLIGNLEPYLFNAVLTAPIGEQGKLSGSIASVNEILFLVAASFIGAASDKVGRRPIDALSFVIMATAYVRHPLAARASQLFFFRGIFAIGTACVSSMLVAIIADYAVASSRGRSSSSHSSTSSTERSPWRSTWCSLRRRISSSFQSMIDSAAAYTSR